MWVIFLFPFLLLSEQDSIKIKIPHLWLMIFWLIFPVFIEFFFLSLWLCCCFILDFIYALKWCGHLNVLEELDYLSGSHVMFVLDVWNALHKRWVGLIIFRVMGYTEANSVLALNTSTVCAPGSALKRWLCSLHSYRPFHPFFRFRLQGGNRNLSPF